MNEPTPRENNRLFMYLSHTVREQKEMIEEVRKAFPTGKVGVLKGDSLLKLRLKP